VAVAAFTVAVAAFTVAAFTADSMEIAAVGVGTRGAGHGPRIYASNGQ
jgi:hypothetical protein